MDQVTMKTRTFHWREGTHQELLLTDDTHVIFKAPLKKNQLLYLKIKQDSSGQRKITWSPKIKFSLLSSPFPTMKPNAVDIAMFYYDGKHYFGTISLDMQEGA